MRLSLTCLSVLRCHTKHAARPCGVGRDGMASNPSSYKLCHRKLPSAQRQSIHLEERMSRCHGEVRRSDRHLRLAPLAELEVDITSLNSSSSLVV